MQKLSLILWKNIFWLWLFWFILFFINFFFFYHFTASAVTFNCEYSAKDALTTLIPLNYAANNNNGTVGSITAEQGMCMTLVVNILKDLSMSCHYTMHRV
jgi:hypothetical protein